ncbi:hypothetical protein HOP51_08605 [Halomonas sp. MCCC 1A11036]|uniref:Phage minor structural protein GP20 n=1 Tax=Billgrantia zhangzhouensis TaxID=2733481 RepID=A0ABS9AEL8_9GAMM|nr:hypothetical protein [Halomonas zhangzhouensis]MCE8020174.1 hypothetical protein [Halomonas zhangzhouensis]NIC38727.1 hypothetical protein [Halomonas desiderata]
MLEIDLKGIGIELDDDQSDALMKAVNDAHEVDVQGLKSKRDELLSKLASRGERDPEPNQEIESYQRELQDRDERLNQLQAQLDERDLETELHRAAGKASLIPEAAADAYLVAKTLFKREEGQFVAKDGDSVLMGKDGPLTVGEWIEAQRETRPHWFPRPVGAGAPGNNGRGQASPSRRSAMSPSQKAEFIRKHGPEAYDRLPR